MDFDYEAPLKRIQGESSRGNDALRDYWLMGSGRSLRELLHLYEQQASNDETTKRPPTTRWWTLGNWSQKNHWQARIARQKEIEDRIALEKFRERHMSADEVVARLSDMARGDLTKIPQFETIQDIADYPMAHVIKKHKVTTRRQKDETEIISVEIELNDPQGALDKLARMLDLYEQAGKSEDKPLVIKVLKGVSTDDL